MSKWKHLSCCQVFLRNYQFKLYLLAPNMNIYFCHFNSIQSPSFTISFCTCNNNFLYRWKKSACGLKHLSNLNAPLPLSYCIVRRHTFGKSRIFLLPNKKDFLPSKYCSKTVFDLPNCNHNRLLQRNFHSNIANATTTTCTKSWKLNCACTTSFIFLHTRRINFI